MRRDDTVRTSTSISSQQLLKRSMFASNNFAILLVPFHDGFCFRELALTSLATYLCLWPFWRVLKISGSINVYGMFEKVYLTISSGRNCLLEFAAVAYLSSHVREAAEAARSKIFCRKAILGNGIGVIG